MTIISELSSKKGISFATLCGLSIFAIGLSIDNIDTIADNTNLIYVHKAEAIPHPINDVKFESLFEHVGDDNIRYKELTDKIQQSRDESHSNDDKIICLIQQVKDAVYKVPETKCP